MKNTLLWNKLHNVNIYLTYNLIITGITERVGNVKHFFPVYHNKTIGLPVEIGLNQRITTELTYHHAGLSPLIKPTYSSDNHM